MSDTWKGSRAEQLLAKARAAEPIDPARLAALKARAPARAAEGAAAWVAGLATALALTLMASRLDREPALPLLQLPPQAERPSAASAQPQSTSPAELPASHPAPARRRIVRAALPSTAPEVPAVEPPPAEAPVSPPLMALPSKTTVQEAPYRARPLRELMELEEDLGGLAARAADRAELRDYLSSKGARLSPELLLLRAELASDAGDCAGALDDLGLLFARPTDLKLVLRADRLSKRCLSVARGEGP